MSSIVSDKFSNTSSNVPSDVVVRKRILYGSAAEAAFGIFQEYCNKTTIHGLRYFGERNRPVIERMFWVLVFIISVSTCSHQTKEIWNKWHDTPVIVTFDEKTIPVWEIPFPAVLVCPETKSYAKIFNFTKAFYDLKHNKEVINNFTDDEWKVSYLAAYLQLCDPKLSLSLNLSIEASRSITDTIREMAPSTNDTVPLCRFNNQLWYCEYLFQPVIANDGLCYQFNGLTEIDLMKNYSISQNDYAENDTFVLEWSLEEGYKDYLSEEYYPERVLAPGKRGGFSFLPFGYDYDIDFICRQAAPGFRIYLQSPDDVPQAPGPYVQVPFKEDVLIKLTPNYIRTAKHLQKYSPERRQCYFTSERQLRFFKFYTQTNCNFECLINHTISKCGCVKFSMPRPDGVPVCGLSDISCYTQAESDLILTEHEFSSLSLHTDRYKNTKCACLPACTSLQYDFEISVADYDFKNFMHSYRSTFLDEHPGAIVSRVLIVFKNKYFTGVKRSELYGTTEFLANCGGLLGLFMGISLLSIVELVYFCTIRIRTNIIRRNRKQKSLALVYANLCLSVDQK